MRGMISVLANCRRSILRRRAAAQRRDERGVQYSDKSCRKEPLAQGWRSSKTSAHGFDAAAQLLGREWFFEEIIHS